MRVQSMEEMGKDFYPNVYQPLLENFDGRGCTDESLFQYFTTLTEKADPLLRRWLLLLSTLQVCLLRPRRLGGEKLA